MATPAPYLVGGGKLPPDDPHVRLARAANEHPTSRHMNVDELTTVTGACAGFLLVMWALLWKADAPLSDTPTVLNGLGGLLFAWIGSLAGASAALLFADRVGTCTYCTRTSLRHLVRIARIAFRRIFGRARCSIQLADPRGLDRTLDGSADAELGPEIGLDASAVETSRITVGLASNGARPKWNEIVDDFAAEAGASKMMVAAGGPNALFVGSLAEAIPEGMVVTRLTHPM